MNTRRTLTASTLTLFISLAAAGCAGSASAPPPLPSGVVSEGLVTATATVKAIDQTTREVTLERTDGSRFKIKAGDEVRNLAQVKVGDVVKTSYHESLAFEVKKAGSASPGAGVAEAGTRAKLGEKPGVAGARTTTVTATIVAIDRNTNRVTLRGPGGDDIVVQARDPKNVAAVSPGDLVELTYTEAVAISVEPGTSGR